MVAHPDQAGVPAGALRVLMSVRGIGEGHRSSIGFRTGVVDGHGEVTFDAPPAFADTGRTEGAPLDATVFRGELRRLHRGGNDADFVFKSLGVTERVFLRNARARLSVFLLWTTFS